MFGLASNTPKTTFNDNDSYNFGLENDNMVITEGDDGRMMTNYTQGGRAQGFPTSRKAGIYYNDKLNEKVKINANYSYKENQLKSSNSTYSQYFLPDTAYNTDNSDNNSQTTHSNNLNFKYSQTVDSLTTLDIEPSFVQSNNRYTKETINRFISQDSIETRNTLTLNGSEIKGTDFGSKFTLKHRFKKDGRRTVLKYNFNYSEKENTGNLYTTYKFNQPGLPDSIVNQLKSGNSLQTSGRLSAYYVEPLSKKFKLELNYEFTSANAEQKKETFNRTGDKLVKDPLFSNEFESKRINHLFMTGLVYETKKIRVSAGSKARQNVATNHNVVTNQDIKQTVSNLLPLASFRYNFSENRQLDLNFTTNSNTPSIQQLQPVPDNSNPNFIQQGNPDLLPTFSTEIRGNYYRYSILKGSSMYLSFSGRKTNNDFSTSTVFDDLGRTVSMPVNVDGNYSFNSYLGGRVRIKQSLLFVSYGVYNGLFSNANFINNQRNRTKNSNYGGNLGLSRDGEKLNAYIGFDINLNKTSSTLNNLSSKLYGATEYSSRFSYQLPKGLFVETDFVYTRNSKRAAGYNINYFIWNASVNKKFFARENLIIGLETYDILNQNISTFRSIQANVIVDSKTTVIGRYVLVKATYKFDNKKEKFTEDEF